MKLANLKIGVLAVLSLGLAQVATAQDIQFSQYYSSSLYLNPAIAGMETSPTVSTNVRSQWRAVNAAFMTTQLSGIYPFVGGLNGTTQRGGVGVSFFNDQSGDGSLRNLGIMGTGAYTLDLELHKISAGIQAGMVQSGIDLSVQQWGAGYSAFAGYNTQYSVAASDGGLAKIQSSKAYPVVNLGLMYGYNPSRSYYNSGISGHAGISGYNLNQPNISLNDNKEYKLPYRLNMTGGLDFFLNQDWRLSPNVLVSTQGAFTQYNLGAYLTYNLVPENGTFFSGTDVILGGWMRVQDAYIASLGLSNSALTLAISYDANSSQYNSFINNRGALEFSAAFRLTKDRTRKRFDTPRI